MASDVEKIACQNCLLYCEGCNNAPKTECVQIIKNCKYEILNSFYATLTSLFKIVKEKQAFRLSLKDVKTFGGGISNRYTLVIKDVNDRVIGNMKVNLTAECCPTIRSVVYQIFLITMLKERKFVIRNIDYEAGEWMQKIIPLPRNIKSGTEFFIGEFRFETSLLV